MIQRRTLVAGLACLPVAARIGAAAAALPVPPNNRISFNVIRKDSKIGEHALDFKRDGEKLIVSVAADIVIKVGPIAVYRYKHRATENWQGDQFVSIEAETNDDGTAKHMSARRTEAGLIVEGSRAPKYTAPARSIPGTNWNRAMLDAPYIDPEDGQLMKLAINLVGSEPVQTASGSVDAKHYALRGVVNLDTFYDQAANWVGLVFAAKDKSEIRLLRV